MHGTKIKENCCADFIWKAKY